MLVNASPDILTQLQAHPQLHRENSCRDTGLHGVLLTDSQIDHTTGLFMLRESSRPWPLWCTDGVFADLLQGNPIAQILQNYCGIQRQRIHIDGRWFVVEGIDGLRWQAIPLPGKPPAYSWRREAAEPGEVIGLLIEHTRSRRRLFYAPGLASIEPLTFEAMLSAHCVLVDGTFWTDDEMLQAGVGHKRAADMGHLPQSGVNGMISWLDRLPPSTRRILIHINNTNPILLEDSPERGVLREHGIEVAHDGMEISL